MTSTNITLNSTGEGSSESLNALSHIGVIAETAANNTNPQTTHPIENEREGSPHALHGTSNDTPHLQLPNNQGASISEDRTSSESVIAIKNSQSEKKDASSEKKKVPTRRRSMGDEVGSGRRKSFRDKVLANIVESTIHGTFGELTTSKPPEAKYVEVHQGASRSAPRRRSSFGEYLPRRRSVRDKILGHMIQAAVMGVAVQDDPPKEKSS